MCPLTGLNGQPRLSGARSSKPRDLVSGGCYRVAGLTSGTNADGAFHVLRIVDPPGRGGAHAARSIVERLLAVASARLIFTQNSVRRREQVAVVVPGQIGEEAPGSGERLAQE